MKSFRILRREEENNKWSVHKSSQKTSNAPSCAFHVTLRTWEGWLQSPHVHQPFRVFFVEAHTHRERTRGNRAHIIHHLEHKLEPKLSSSQRSYCCEGRHVREMLTSLPVSLCDVWLLCNTNLMRGNQVSRLNIRTLKKPIIARPKTTITLLTGAP